MKSSFQKVYNRLEFNQHLNNKKQLLHNMKIFYKANRSCVDALPLTFHIRNGLQDSNFKKF